MRGFTRPLLAVLLAVIVSLPSTSLEIQAQSAVVELPVEPEPTTNLTTGLPFIENVGQFPDAARFRAGNLWLAEDSLWLTVIEPAVTSEISPFEGQNSESAPVSVAPPRQVVNLKLSFVGANAHPRIEPFGRQETYISYIRGNDPAQWRSRVPTWTGVRYVDLYPGLDLEVSSVGGQWTWRLVASEETQAASQSLTTIQLRVEGGENLTLVDNRLQVKTTLGEVNLPLILVDDVQALPYAPQASMATPDTVHQPFTAIYASSISKAAETSALRWATFFGGSDFDSIHALELTSGDEIVIAGQADSADFPVTPGAYDTEHSKSESFVARFSEDGTTLRWATFLGGSKYDSIGALELTASEEIVVVGETDSPDFPVTSGTYDTDPHYGASFVARFSADGTALRWATFFGGSGALGLTADDEIVIAGDTSSANFPVTEGEFIQGARDGFVAKLSQDGAILHWAAFLGGSGYDYIRAMALTSGEKVVVAGHTYSADFPVTSGTYDTEFDGDSTSDSFIAQLVPGSGTEPTPYPTLDRLPLIFIPGVGGSTLLSSGGEELWPGLFDRKGLGRVCKVKATGVWRR